MEDTGAISKEEHEARENFRTSLVRLGKQVTDQQEGRGPDLSMVPPHLVGKR